MHLQRPLRSVADFALLALAALILRAATLGDPNIHFDEAFYLMVGDAMHHGAVPYVDIWDRKPLGIFLIYWLISAVSVNPLAYQLAALVCAAATAWVLVRIARHWVSDRAAILAGISYLAMLNVLDGMGGQSPVFYNLPMAMAAWLLVRGWTDTDIGRFRRNHLWAMALCGICLMIKQTTLFEGVFFGLAGLYWMQRSGAGLGVVLRQAMAAIAIAALPTAAIAAWYAGHGWWDNWFQAMITSSLKRQPIAPGTLQHNMWVIVRLLSVFGGIAVLGLVGAWREQRFVRFRALVLGWLAVAVLALFAVPNFFGHYALPLLLPLTLLAALGFDRKGLGAALFAMNLIVALILGTAFDLKRHQASRAAFAEMARVIEQTKGDGQILILGGPPLLYTLTGSKPMTALAFPEHLINAQETDVSPIRTKPEVERLIAARPRVVMVPASYAVRPTDGRIELIEAYLAANCGKVWQGNYLEPRGVERGVEIFGCQR